MPNKPKSFKRPSKEELQNAYSRLKSVRKVGAEFGYTGEGIRVLMHQHGIEIAHPNKDMYSCDHEFFSRDTEESFYIAGYFAADGCIKYRRKDTEPSIIYMALGVKDANHLQLMKEKMGIGHPLHTKIVKNSSRNLNWNDSEERELFATSWQMCRDLARFNVVPRKTHTMTFPQWLTDHPLVHHYMRGYNDGDGSFFIPSTYQEKGYPQVYYSLRGTIEFLTVFRSILERECGLPERTKPIRMNCNIGVLEYGGNGIVGKIANFLYKDATIFLPRKYDVAMQTNIGQVCSI